ncbi:MAG: histidine phosphatase family protein [Candidatus Dojkabacteria bacterium]
MNEDTFHLTRHGETVNNLTKVLNTLEDPLTEFGKHQALELGVKLKESGFIYDVVLVSPLLRAQDTAKIITSELGIGSYETIADLREREFGNMAGVSYDEISKMEDILVTPGGITYFLSGENAETFQELFERAQRVLKDIQENYQGKKVLIVAHGDIGKMLYAAFYERDWKEVLQLFHFRNTDTIVLSKSFNYKDVFLFREA